MIGLALPTEGGEAVNSAKLESPPKNGSKIQRKSNFFFVPPQEAPVFYPTEEEFEDPLKYIQYIGREGQQYGIMKIIPPEGWKPPFALKYDSFKFKPRIQKINELEGKTRMKLNFMSKVAREVAKEGKLPKLPFIEKSLLDLHLLYILVSKEGGYDEVNRKKKWNDIAVEMGFIGKSCGLTLKHNFETWLVPYIDARKRDEELDRLCESDDVLKLTNIRELKSLEFLGPGPKMPICNYNFSSSMKTRTRHKKVQYEFDPLAKYMCQSCGLDDSDGSLATCKNCDDKYHMVCLTPPLAEQPKEWLCPKCIVASDSANPFEEFGFETAEKEYTLTTFGQMADRFKYNHFKTPGRLVPTKKVEQEYWKIMGSVEGNTTVEYGADLSTLDVGSGFPTEANMAIDGYEPEVIKKYVNSKWNLNNLSVLHESALKHITSNISGMKVPWVYVGMCFSTFCWHNEDHWSYSINYLHWGEPKTWYGVSGHNADKFEEAMKDLAPDLFESQPDLLHQLVTNMNPNLLMEKDVPIFRTDQKEGEFVVTFPRAYHAGFNQGFNFAEACNFAPADWISMGRDSVLYYSAYRRNCVFSHDELICKIAENASEVHKELGLAAYKDMKSMIESEYQRRKVIFDGGLITIDKSDFSSMKDDSRQCFYCKTTCFLSAISCQCSGSIISCLDHWQQLCHCDPSQKILKIQYSIPELKTMFKRFKSVISDIKLWMKNVESICESEEADSTILDSLLLDAVRSDSSGDDCILDFEKNIHISRETCKTSNSLIQEIVQKKETKKKYSLSELNTLNAALHSLPWSLPQKKCMEKIVKNVRSLHFHLSKLMDKENISKDLLKSCLQYSDAMNVSFSDLPFIHEKLKILAESEEEKCNYLGSSDKETIEEVDVKPDIKLINAHIKEIQEWNEKTNKLMSSKSIDMGELESLLKEGDSLKVESEMKEKLSEILDTARIWSAECQDLLAGKVIKEIDVLKNFITEGKQIPVNLETIPILEKEIAKMNSWLIKVREAFSNKKSKESLLETLWPRKFKPRIHYRNKRRLSEEPSIKSGQLPTITESTLSNAFEEELNSLLELRWENCQKKSYFLKNEKVNCFCGREITANSVTCDLCQTMFHIECFPGDTHFNNKFLNLSYKSPYCTYCIRTKRPSLDDVEELIGEAGGIGLKTPECFVLTFLHSKFTNASKVAQSFLSSREITLLMNKLMSGSSSLDNTRVKLNERKLLDLKTMVMQIDLLEVTMPESVQLWTLFEATKLCALSRKRLYNSNSAYKEMKLKPTKGKKMKLLSEKRDGLKKGGGLNGRRKSSQSEDSSVSSYSEEQKDLPTTVLEKFKGKDLQEYLNEERCASDKCLRPIDDEVNWVQCDGFCRLWFHMRCVNVDAHDVSADEEYICLKCMVQEKILEKSSPTLKSISSSL